MTRIIDLNSPDGNAFALMGIARQEARRLGWDSVLQTRLIDAMMAAPTYAAALDILDRELPHYFEFINDPRDTARGNE